MNYQPGNLLREYAVGSVSEKRVLVGVFLIVSMTHSGIHAITFYDSDGFWKPASKTYFAHSDIKNKSSWCWEIQ